MILSLLQIMPESLHSQASAYLNPQVADITTTHLHFPNGVSAHIFVSWLNPLKEQRLVVVGSEAMAVFDDVQPWSDKLKIYPHQVNWVNDFPVSEKAEAITVSIPQSEPLRNECQHFIDCIQHDKQPTTDGAEAVAVLHVISAADESIRTGNSIVLHQFNQKSVFYPSKKSLEKDVIL
jgi:UDP-2-acetamido-3-amino-2,3-dideoxy-glucuronate N-acetyltransferase